MLSTCHNKTERTVPENSIPSKDLIRIPKTSRSHFFLVSNYISLGNLVAYLFFFLKFRFKISGYEFEVEIHIFSIVLDCTGW